MSDGREPFDFGRPIPQPPPPNGGYGNGGYGGSYGPWPGEQRQRPAISAPPTSVLDAVGGPSTWRLVAPLLVAILAGGSAWLFGNRIEVAIGCWLAAGPVAISLLALFVTHDIGQRARPIYAARPWVSWLHRATMVLIVIAVFLSALRIADWAGRR
jgi:hypothetical protein